jgi:F-type H+-transporting ATPase subunit a
VRFLKPAAIALAGIVGAFLLSSQFPVKLPPIEVAPERLGDFQLPLLGHITNTTVTTWLVMLLLALLAFFAMRKRSLVPSGLQNMMEAMVEAIYSLSLDIAGEKRVRKFFPIVATIFFFVLLSNWLGLIPGVGTIGLVEKAAEGPGTVIVPFLRSPSTDLMTTAAMALITMVLVQVFGMQALGVLGYWSKFFNFRGLWKFIGAIAGFKPRPAKATGFVMLAFFAFLDFVVGFLELISELAKILSFSFRLFGNIFAGEVLLAVIAFLVPYLLPLPFLGLEVFVGFIQAFVFFILSLVFMTTATASHGGEGQEATH